jgi:3-oxoacyl-[acyl-carrier protein] reductase
MIPDDLFESSERRLKRLAMHLAPSPCSSDGLATASSTGSSMQLQGKVALITGSGKGIGQATAILLSSQGASCVLVDIDDKALESVMSQIKASGGRAVSVKADMMQEGSAEVIVKAAVEAFGRIDIIINNAGFTWDGMLQKTTDKMFETMMNIHCLAPFKLIRAALPFMREVAKKEKATRGEACPRCIINISSTSGTHGSSGQVNYSTAKAGVLGLTKTIAKELGPFNIRCNALAFGLIDTRLTRPKAEGAEGEVRLSNGEVVSVGMKTRGPFTDEFIKMGIPLGRAGSVEDAAGAIMMLCSPWASYITGQCIEVNGGAFM